MKNLNITNRNRVVGVMLSIAMTSLLTLPQNVLGQDSNEGKTLLAVFAHPDDEGTVAPILAKYASEGVKVHLVIVTDGRYGTNDFTDHEAGEGLVAMRKEEMKCAAKELGVELTHLSYHDQLKSGEGYDGHIPHIRAMIQEVYGIVEEIKPDVIITWGPDGGSTHVDHRSVSLTMTQIFVSKVWDKPMKLYYYGTPSELVEDPERKILRGQHNSYLTTRVDYSEEDLEKTYRSRVCHKSQISAESLEGWKERRAKNGMTIYLRKFVGPPAEIQDSVFN